MGIASDLRMALDAATFASDALGFVPDEWQARVLRWTGKQLLMNCARQSGKSHTAAILAAHRALYFADSLILVVSPSERQSREFFIKVGDCFDRLAVKPVFTEDNKLSCVLANHSRIVSLPGSEKTVRGFSAVDLLLIDEAARVPDELYAAVRPMLAVSAGALVALSTPFGKRGWFFEAWENGGASWERVKVTASENPRIAPAFLAEEKAAMPPLFFQSEYECEFVETIDQVFSYELVLSALSSSVKPMFDATPGEAGAVAESVKPMFAGGA